MTQDNRENIEVFNRDAASNDGYLYTTGIGLSSRLATQRTLDTIVRVGRFTGRSVLDVGCGDGHFTLQFWDLCHPSKMAGVDAAEKAIEVANSRVAGRAVEFKAGDSHHLPFANDSFDVVQLQSMLHHDDDPLATIREAFRIAPEILIHEPNGNNMGLKIIEKVSPYHREHAEKSYSMPRMNAWIREAGGRIEESRYAGFVPMFCPDWMARAMKAVEPILEATPLLRNLGCSVYVIRARRINAGR